MSLFAAGRFAKTLIRVAEASSRRPFAVLIIGWALAILSVTAFCTRVEYFTRRSDLASPDKEYQRRWQSFVDEFGDEDDVVVVVRGADRERMTAAIDAVAQRVAARPDRFDRLFHCVDLTALKDRALLHLPAEQLRDVQQNLERMGPLLSAPIGPLAWRSLTLVNLLRQARERAGKFDPDTALSSADEQFLTQLLGLVGAASATLTDPIGYRNPWGSLMPVTALRSGSHDPIATELLDRPQYFFSSDGRLAFLLARPVKDVASFTPALAAVDAMRSIVAEVRPEFADLELGLTGLPVLETDEMVASQRDSTRAAWLALLGTALLYALVYGGCRYPLLTVATLLTGTAWAMGWLALTVGHVNILSATFAVMLIGLGDYGVLWVTHYEERRRAGDDPKHATRHTATHVGPGILTASVATALAFFATMFADFRAVAELGWIAGCGVLFCALGCFTVLPALIRLTDRRGLLAPLSVVGSDGDRRPVYAPDRAPRPWLPLLTRHPRWSLAAAGLLTLFGLAGATRVGYDHNLLNMQAPGLDSVKWEHALIDATAGASWHAASIARTPAEALALKARYEKLPGVSRVVEVASLIPDGQVRKLELVADIHRRLDGLPSAAQPIVPFTPPAREAQKEATLLLGALRPLAPISKQAVLPQLVRQLETLRDHPLFADAARARERLHEFETHLTSDLLADLHRLRAVSTPRPIPLADLPMPLRERYVGQSGTFLVEVYAKDNLWDIAPMTRFVADIRAVDPEATGKPFGTLEGLLSMQHGFAWAGVYALIVIVLVLAADFRSLKHTLLALLPLAVGVVWLMGTLGALGWSLNPANMIALPLIVGAGVDNGVHVLHDYRGRRRHGPYRLAATTGRGIAVAALTTVLGFGTLALSGHRGLSGLGVVLALGVTCCMAAALVILPALLHVTGQLREKRLRRAA